MLVEIETLLWQMWAMEIEVSWGASSGTRPALPCAMLPCSGMGIFCEQKLCSRWGKARGRTLSFMKSQKWRQRYRADAFFVWTLSKGDRTGLCSSRFPGFSLGKEFKKEWANVLLSMRQISKMHAPTGWVTKTILSLKMVLVPVIYVQQMRNYSGSSCSTRTSSCSSELWFFICFVATFHNVKNWGPSSLTFPAQTTVVPCKSIACGEIQYLSHVSCCSRKWCTV